MKKILPFIIAVFAYGNLAAQVVSIPNGNFSQWSNTTWIEPSGYTTSIDEVMGKGGISGFIPNVTQLPAWDNTSGNYAVQLQTVAVNGDTIPGFITNSINDPLNGLGGVPYSGQPNGIIFWYNFSPATGGDTAAMVLVFKKAGSVIGEYILPVTVATSSYPAKTFIFSPALTTSADTVIFAAASSLDILEGKSGHPGTTFAMSEVEFIGGPTTQPADLNWNFSTWANDTAFAPTGWSGLFPGTQRTTDAYTGDSYALKLVTTFIQDNGNAEQGIATTGQIKNQYITGGYPYTNTDDSLEFYYKYAPANISDSASAVMEFKTAGIITNVVGLKFGAASSYTQIVAPFTLGTAPDSVIVVLFSSTSNGSTPLSDVGSTLQVDNIEFASQRTSTGIKPVLLANNSILVYPNPATKQLTIAGSGVINEVRMVNILGQTLLDKQYAIGVAFDHQSIDVSSLPAGDYFISVTSGGATSTGKISVINK